MPLSETLHQLASMWVRPLQWEAAWRRIQSPVKAPRLQPKTFSSYKKYQINTVPGQSTPTTTENVQLLQKHQINIKYSLWSKHPDYNWKRSAPTKTSNKLNTVSGQNTPTTTEYIQLLQKTSYKYSPPPPSKMHQLTTFTNLRPHSVKDMTQTRKHQWTGTTYILETAYLIIIGKKNLSIWTQIYSKYTVQGHL